MEFSAEHTFAASIDAVWAMFCDPGSHLAKFESMGHRDIEILAEDTTPTTIHLEVTRLVDLELPGFAKRVLSPTNTVVTTDDWTRESDGTCHGVQLIDTKGAPVKVGSTTTLVTDPDEPANRTRYTIDVTLDVKVPLIGGKLAGWAKGTMSEQLDQEFSAGDAWLSAHQ